MILAKFGTNLLNTLNSARKDLMPGTDVDYWSPPTVPKAILATYNFPGLMTCTKYPTVSVKKKIFFSFNVTPALDKIRKTIETYFRCCCTLQEKIITS